MNQNLLNFQKHMAVGENPAAVCFFFCAFLYKLRSFGETIHAMNRKKGIEISVGLKREERIMAMKKENEPKRRRMQMAIAYGTVGVIALTAIAAGMVNRGAKTPKIDLNATPTPGVIGQTAERTQDPVKEEPVKENPVQSAEHDPQPQGHTIAQAEPFEEKQEEQPVSEQVADASKNPTEPEKEITETAGSETALPVVNPKNPFDGLQFSAETGMLWPVTGQAKIVFSPDHVIYNKTLDSYRTTDYVFLEGAVGTHVSAAAEGVVTAVSEELWTGTTVTMRVGENSEIVYGLLGNVAVKEGDRVKEGTVIAEIAEPTRYFLEEGSGLYLKVLENGAPVDPMLYLKD